MAEVRETKLAGQLSRLVSAGADEGGDTRDGRIGAILNDFLDRRGRGEHVAADDVLARHPDLADELREHLATLREIEPPGEQIARLIDQGLLNPSSDRAYLAELGQYKILSYVGRGGMGIVLKAYEPALRRTVALKLLRPELVTDATALRRFEREAQAAAKLQHPNIVAIHAVVLDGRSPYIVMEYVAGRSLADLIRKRGPLDADTARHIFRQLLLALGAAHAAGLIHRDVKAANILLQETATEKPPDCAPSSLHRPVASSPLVKLADFGLARVLTSQTRLTLSDSTLGTPEYMSPEQARGEEDIDERSDLYSAGVVLYEMLTGRTPFRAERPSAVIHRILHEQPADPRQFAKNVDPVLRSVALRLMAKERDDRMMSTGEVLDSLGGSRPVASPFRQRQTRRMLLIGALLAVVVAFVVLGTSALMRSAPITAARVDESAPNQILVRRGTGAEWYKFVTLAESVELADARVIQLTPGGSILVVAISLIPLDENESVVVAFTPDGSECWRQALHGEFRWFDNKRVSHASAMLVGDFDNQPGDELVVLAKEPEYCAACINLIDPRANLPGDRVRQTFWHTGQIDYIEPISNYFDDGRPAILAMGCNNALKPSGDNDLVAFPVPADHSIVAAAAILDPLDMAGMAPPFVNQHDITPAHPVAYAFLNMATTERCFAQDGVEARPAEIANFQKAGDIRSTGTGTEIEVSVGRGVNLLLDMQLGLIRPRIKNPDMPEHADADFWGKRWRRVMKHGRLVSGGDSESSP